VGWELVRWHLEGMFGGVEEGCDADGVPIMRVMGVVDVKQTGEHELTLEWESSASNDMVADSTLALVTGIDRSPASAKLTSNAHNHAHEHIHPHADSESDSERIQRLAMFLESHFGEVHIGVPEPEKGHEDGRDEVPEQALLIRLDEADAVVHLKSMTVTSANETLRKRVEIVVDMALTTVSSLSEMYSGGTSSVTNDAVIKPTEKGSTTDAPETGPTQTEAEDSAEMSKEVEA